METHKSIDSKLNLGQQQLPSREAQILTLSTSIYRLKKVEAEFTNITTNPDKQTQISNYWREK